MSKTSSSKIEDVSINYEEDGKLLVREIGKKILSRGAWATIIFLYQEYDRAKDKYKPAKVSLRRYQKKGGDFVARSKFVISNEKQARLIAENILEWYTCIKG